jgi:hypothetical protein
MAGLVPAIHLSVRVGLKDVDARHRPGMTTFKSEDGGRFPLIPAKAGI